MPQGGQSDLLRVASFIGDAKKAELVGLAFEKSTGGLLELIISDARYANPPSTIRAILLGIQYAIFK